MLFDQKCNKELYFFVAQIRVDFSATWLYPQVLTTKIMNRICDKKQSALSESNTHQKCGLSSSSGCAGTEWLTATPHSPKAPLTEYPEGDS